MSLRPRYSLLTLLVLTALVAGGVKLWYGPHHVVERFEPYKEFEYTYTRNLSGEKVLQGTCVCRVIDPQNPNTCRIWIFYYRHGMQINWVGTWTVITHGEDDTDEVNNAWLKEFGGKVFSLLNSDELKEFQNTIDQQKAYLRPSEGYRLWQNQDEWNGPSSIEDISVKIPDPY